jgi:hypothetical protein
MFVTADPLLWEDLLQRPLGQRRGAAPAELIEFIGRYNQAVGSPAVARAAPPCAGLDADLDAALAGLPEAVLRHLAPCLLGIFVMDGTGSSAVSSVVAGPDGELIGAFVAIDAGAFDGASANAWFERRENSAFEPAPRIRLEARIAEAHEDSRVTALQFVLLHEFGHVLAACRDLAPQWWRAPAGEAPAYPLLDLCWQAAPDGSFFPRAGHDFPLRDQVVYYANPRLSLDDAEMVYRGLRRTGFPTLYAATSIHEDIADSFASFVHVRLMGRPLAHRLLREGSEVALGTPYWQTPDSAARAALFEAILAAPPVLLRRAAPVRDLLGARVHDFLALAPFLRLDLAGADLHTVGQQLLQRAGAYQHDACLWMNLATVLFALRHDANGHAVQDQALQMRRLYELPAAVQPARLRLLMLMAPGGLAENTALDCLLEHGSVDLLYYYASPHAPLPDPLPEHDALMVAFSSSPLNDPVLARLDTLLRGWPRPVVNQPCHVPNTERRRASELLQGVPGLAMSRTHELARSRLAALAAGSEPAGALFEGCAFPLVVRPVGSHAGHDLERIADGAGLARYLEQVPDARFHVAPFVDYSGPDGLFRKFRIALVDGVPHAGHMALSSHWVVHYLDAGMADSAAKRAEEQAFMEGFDNFARRHAGALAAIHARTRLDYLCIDCAETRAGELLVFEIGHAMVVHAMDPAELYPYKQAPMAKLSRAFEDYLLRLRTAA